METSYVDETITNLLTPPGYIGPERQLVGHRAPARAALPEPPPSPDAIRKVMPKGFTYLGPRDDPAKGLVFEAQHRLGVSSCTSVDALVALCQTVATAFAAGDPCDLVPGFNRRRKRRARREKDLQRCGFGTCNSLVWPDQMPQHLADCHPHAAGAALSEIYTRPAYVEDDGTGDDLTLDDPACTRAVKAED